MTPNDFILKQIQMQKQIDADFKSAMQQAEAMGKVFDSILGPKLVPPNPSEVKVEPPLFIDDVIKNGGF